MKERVYEQTPFLIYCSSEITQISRHAHSSRAPIILLPSSVAYFYLCNPPDASINKLNRRNNQTGTYGERDEGIMV